MGAAIILNRGGGHTKVDCHANYANCDVVAVLIPFQIFILSVFQSFSETERYFYRKRSKICFFMTRCYFFTHNCMAHNEALVMVRKIILIIFLVFLITHSSCAPVLMLVSASLSTSQLDRIFLVTVAPETKNIKNDFVVFALFQLCGTNFIIVGFVASSQWHTLPK